MSSSFEAKDYKVPSKSKTCVDDNQFLSSNQIPAKSDHNLSSNYQTSLKSLPQHQRPMEVDPLKDNRLSNNHNQPPPPSSQHQPPTLYSNVEQPNKDRHAKLTSAEPPVTVHPKSKNYLSQPDGSPLQQQQPPTPTPTLLEKPDKQPITLAKLTSAEPVTYIHPKNYLLQSNEAPPSQPISPDQHCLKNPPLPPPSPSLSPQTRTLSWNVEQATKYEELTNQVTSTEPKTDYPEHYLLQPDGPPPPQPYPLPRTLSPKDQLKNVKAPAARNPPPNKSCCTCSIL